MDQQHQPRLFKLDKKNMTELKLTDILSSHVYSPIIAYLEKSKGNYLEIGVFNGVGLHNVATTYPKKLCEAIDPFIEDGYTTLSSGCNTGAGMDAQRNSTMAFVKECKNVNLNIMTSHEYFKQLTPVKIAKLNIGAVLIDGNHHYEFVVNDYQLAMTVIDRKEGLVVFDDIQVNGVRQALDEFTIEYADRIEKTESIADVATAVFIKETL
jgi:hypothetical protein